MHHKNVYCCSPREISHQLLDFPTTRVNTQQFVVVAAEFAFWRARATTAILLHYYAPLGGGPPDTTAPRAASRVTHKALMGCRIVINRPKRELLFVKAFGKLNRLNLNSLIHPTHSIGSINHTAKIRGSRQNAKISPMINVLFELRDIRGFPIRINIFQPNSTHKLTHTKIA